MEELLRTNNIVLISYLEATLRSNGIEPIVLDEHFSVMEGSIGAIPRRLVVDADDAPKAKRLVAAALEDD